MNQSNERFKRSGDAVIQNTMTESQRGLNEPKGYGQYTIDKAFAFAGRELALMEKEKPGTRRKLAGIACLTLGAGGMGTGLYLLLM